MTDTTAVLNATTLGARSPARISTPRSAGTATSSALQVEQTFENEGKVVTAVISAGDIRLVLNQDDGKLGWDRTKGQGFSMQFNVAAACRCRCCRRTHQGGRRGARSMSRPIVRGACGCSSSTTWTGSNSASRRRSRGEPPAHRRTRLAVGLTVLREKSPTTGRRGRREIRTQHTALGDQRPRAYDPDCIFRHERDSTPSNAIDTRMRHVADSGRTRTPARGSTGRTMPTAAPLPTSKHTNAGRSIRSPLTARHT